MCMLYSIFNFLTLHTEAAQPPQAVYAIPLLLGGELDQPEASTAQ